MKTFEEFINSQENDLNESNKGDIIASAPTKERLEKLINDFYYSKNYVITDDYAIYNTSTKKTLESVIVVKTKGRFQFRYKV